MVADGKDAKGNVVQFEGLTLEWGNGERVVHLAPDGRRIDWTGRKTVAKGQTEATWKTVTRNETLWLITKRGRYCVDTTIPVANRAVDAQGNPAKPGVKRECGLKARPTHRLNKIRFHNHYGGYLSEATRSKGNTRQL